MWIISRIIFSNFKQFMFQDYQLQNIICESDQTNYLKQGENHIRTNSHVGFSKHFRGDTRGPTQISPPAPRQTKIFRRTARRLD